jgi:hypothetical protein
MVAFVGKQRMSQETHPFWKAINTFILSEEERKQAHRRSEEFFCCGDVSEIANRPVFYFILSQFLKTPPLLKTST